MARIDPTQWGVGVRVWRAGELELPLGGVQRSDRRLGPSARGHADNERCGGWACRQTRCDVCTMLRDWLGRVRVLMAARDPGGARDGGTHECSLESGWLLDALAPIRDL
jgi:hypothetical protein